MILPVQGRYVKTGPLKPENSKALPALLKRFANHRPKRMNLILDNRGYVVKPVAA